MGLCNVSQVDNVHVNIILQNSGGFNIFYRLYLKNNSGIGEKCNIEYIGKMKSGILSSREVEKIGRSNQIQF